MLAGVAAGALGLALVPMVGVTAAQSANVFASAYCYDGTAQTVPGFEGTPGDPTTVIGGCSVPAGAPTNFGLLETSQNTDPTTNFYWINVSGSAGIAPATGVAPGDFAQVGPQTLVVREGVLDEGDVVVLAGTASPSTTTVTVRRSSVSTASDPGSIGAGNTVSDSSFDIAFYGTPASVVIVPALYAIPSFFELSPQHGITGSGLGDNEAWVSVVTAVDSAGNQYPLNPGLDPAPATVELSSAPSANLDTLSVTEVPAPVAAALGLDPRFFVGVLSSGSTRIAPEVGWRPVGTNNYTARLGLTLPNLSASSSYVVSNTLGGSYTASFDKASYNRGETATLTVCVNDLNGLIVPDGLSWTDDSSDFTNVDRGMRFDFNAETVVPAESSAEISSFSSDVSTVNGCDTWTIIMPSEDIDFTVAFDTLTLATPVNGFVGPTASVTEAGWAVGVTGPGSISVKVGDGGGPTPPVPPVQTIMITGDRINKRSVMVEGTSKNLEGAVVTPWFRFPGQVGFTEGVGTRTVDTEGNFQWQRRTGKKIAVQFRDGLIRSNTVIIQSR